MLLLVGVAFLAFMCFPYSTKQYVAQGFIFGGLLYLPLYPICSFAIHAATRKNVNVAR